MYFLNKKLFSFYLLNLTFLNDILFNFLSKKNWINLKFYFESYEFSNF